MANAANILPPIHIRGLDHLLLIVDDMERAIAFYQGVLGLKVKERLAQYGMAELSAGNQGLDLVDTSTNEGAWARPTAAGGGNLHHFCFSADVGQEGAQVQAARGQQTGHQRLHQRGQHDDEAAPENRGVNHSAGTRVGASSRNTD